MKIFSRICNFAVDVMRLVVKNWNPFSPTSSPPIVTPYCATYNETMYGTALLDGLGSTSATPTKEPIMDVAMAVNLASILLGVGEQVVAVEQASKADPTMTGADKFNTVMATVFAGVSASGVGSAQFKTWEPVVGAFINSAVSTYSKYVSLFKKPAVAVVQTASTVGTVAQ